MNDMVRREDVIRALVERYELISEQDIRNTVNGVPAADVRENVHGNWIGIDDFPHEDYECDRCGHVIDGCFDEDWLPKFCPNCGADMRTRSENNGV